MEMEIKFKDSCSTFFIVECWSVLLGQANVLFPSFISYLAFYLKKDEVLRFRITTLSKRKFSDIWFGREKNEILWKLVSW